MIALPPVLVERCVDAGSAAAEHARAIQDIAGSRSAMAPVVAKIRAAKWPVISDEMQNGERHVVFKFLPETTYREIAGFIHSAQQAELKLTGRFDPPICGTKEK